MRVGNGTGSASSETNPVSLMIFELVLNTAADELPQIILLICCTAAIVAALAIAIVRLSRLRGLLFRMARRLGLRPDWRVYTILGDDRFREDDGTEPAADDFHYVSMK